jgi:hypothetical protein
VPAIISSVCFFVFLKGYRLVTLFDGADICTVYGAVMESRSRMKEQMLTPKPGGIMNLDKRKIIGGVAAAMGALAEAEVITYTPGTSITNLTAMMSGTEISFDPVEAQFVTGYLTQGDNLYPLRVAYSCGMSVAMSAVTPDTTYPDTANYSAWSGWYAEAGNVLFNVGDSVSDASTTFDSGFWVAGPADATTVDYCMGFRLTTNGTDYYYGYADFTVVKEGTMFEGPASISLNRVCYETQANTAITVTEAVPEPASVMLILSGFVFLRVFRKLHLRIFERQ